VIGSAVFCLFLLEFDFISHKRFIEKQVQCKVLRHTYVQDAKEWPIDQDLATLYNLDCSENFSRLRLSKNMFYNNPIRTHVQMSRGELAWGSKCFKP